MGRILIQIFYLDKFLAHGNFSHGMIGFQVPPPQDMAEAIRKDQQTENRNTTELTQSQDKGEVTRSTRAIGRKHKTDSPISQVKFEVCVLYLHRIIFVKSEVKDTLYTTNVVFLGHPTITHCEKAKGRDC